jgi:hypothetical protein
MTGGQLKVDYEQLAALHRRLDTASDNMRDDSDTMSALASAVGEERLAERIREFGKDWSVHRADIRENIDWLRDKVERISDELEKIDGDLARGLQDAGAPPAPPAGRGPAPV